MFGIKFTDVVSSVREEYHKKQVYYDKLRGTRRVGKKTVIPVEYEGVVSDRGRGYVSTIISEGLLKDDDVVKRYKIYDELAKEAGYTVEEFESVMVLILTKMFACETRGEKMNLGVFVSSLEDVPGKLVDVCLRFLRDEGVLSIKDMKRPVGKYVEISANMDYFMRYVLMNELLVSKRYEWLNRRMDKLVKKEVEEFYGDNTYND